MNVDREIRAAIWNQMSGKTNEELKAIWAGRESNLHTPLVIDLVQELLIKRKVGLEDVESSNSETTEPNMNSKELYKSAYKLHHSEYDRDFSEALKTYKMLIDQFPDSQEAEWAKIQIAKIQDMDESEKRKYDKGRQAISVLGFFAWLNLICGIIGAIFIWKTMGTMEVPYSLISGTHTEINPFGVALAVALLLEGIFVCAFFLVVCSMAENLIEIQENTNRQRELA